MDQGNLNLSDVAVAENRASSGGAIANTGVLTMNRCLLNSNDADSNGGGIFSSTTAGGMRIFNSTITNNTAATGGAIHNSWAITLINSTVTNNTATENAQSIFNTADGLLVRILNTIIGNDNASSVTSLSGTFFSLGNNIVTDARGSTGFMNGVNDDQVSDNNAINPLLGDLIDNGGQTETRALLPESTAIDRGNNCIMTGSCAIPLRVQLLSDQRGFARPLFGGIIDIGAFEGSSAEIVAFGSVGFDLSGGSFYSGSLAVLTGATSGQKIYKSINPFGHFKFENLTDEIFVLEIRTKRSKIAFGPLVLSFADSPPFAFASKAEISLQVKHPSKAQQRYPGSWLGRPFRWR
ncbi:MAG: choice-of-anchor Q domain-containing protein [Pyrinomonadaceae bacterium]